MKTNGIIANDNTYEDNGNDGNDDKNKNGKDNFFTYFSSCRMLFCPNWPGAWST